MYLAAVDSVEENGKPRNVVMGPITQAIGWTPDCEEFVKKLAHLIDPALEVCKAATVRRVIQRPHVPVQIDSDATHAFYFLKGKKLQSGPERVIYKQPR